jgi:hypothetical protein
MTLSASRSSPSRHLLARLIESPALAAEVRALSPTSFASLVRELGVEDAGELVSLATTEQLVAAFDEHLFTNQRPGEREVLDPERFAAWLEVLLEAGAERAAARLAELSEDFVLAALTSLLCVFDHDALRERLSGGSSGGGAPGWGDDEPAAAVDKALESCLSLELDGYLLVSRDGAGWDAVLDVLLALDRQHRALFERLLDRAARLTAPLLDDLDELGEALTQGDALADDVEGERELRRGARGFVAAESARAFLELARASPTKAERDPLTRAYFRGLDAPARGPAGPGPARARAAPRALERPSRLAELVRQASARGEPERAPSLEAWSLLAREAPERFDERLEELAYLANVLVAGASTAEGERLSAVLAAEAALATVAYGAALAATERARTGPRGARTKRGHASSPCASELAAALAEHPADLLFRRGAGALAARRGGPFVRSFAELARLAELGP